MYVYLVDCENVGALKVSRMRSDLIYYFVRDEEAFKNVYMENRIITHHNGGRDALDFCLDSFLGYLIGVHGDKYDYCIISSDKGYDNVVNFWQEQGINIQRVNGKQVINLSQKNNYENTIETLIDSLPNKKQRNLYYQCKAYTINTKKKNKKRKKWNDLVECIIGDSLSATERKNIANYMFDQIVKRFNMA